jgi:hypothetical protein
MVLAPSFQLALPGFSYIYLLLLHLAGISTKWEILFFGETEPEEEKR